jgi:2-keto-4-pentenoate hydratase/2-oxohepta-3-ene-1,7-dioic acid hydratase in catechol pathway
MNIVRTSSGTVAIDIGGGKPSLPVCQILGIGRNYAEHAREQGAAVPDRPMVFTKNIASLCLHADDIRVPQVCRDPATGGDQTDFEAELGVVLGAPIRDASERQAMDAVLGYCCANDVSARWWQKQGSGGQFWRGKSFDTFCPIGPSLAPAGEVGDPGNLRVRCRVNGQTMQDANTNQMLFPVGTLLSELSRGMTLPAGTLLLTGTPSGVGMARTPPVWLKHGDVVEVEIERVGLLRNRVVME